MSTHRFHIVTDEAAGQAPVSSASLANADHDAFGAGLQPDGGPGAGGHAAVTDGVGPSPAARVGAVALGVGALVGLVARAGAWSVQAAGDVGPVALGVATAAAVALVAHRRRGAEVSESAARGLDRLLAGRRAVHVRARRAADALRQHAPVAQVLRAQLQSVVKETEEASAALVDRLTRIDQAMTAIVDFVTGRTAETDALVSGSQATIAENRASLAALGGFLARRAAEAAEDHARFSSVVGEARSLEARVSVVRGIARSTNILALNAAIEAARAGQHGLTFAVVADEVRRLSVESGGAADEVSDGIGRMARAVEAGILHRLEETEVARQHEDATVGALTTQLTTLADHHQQLAAEHAETVRQIGARNGELALLVMDALGSLQFQDITRQRIEHVVETLAQMGDQLTAAVALLDAGGPVDPVAQADATDRLSVGDLTGGYVMASQRDVHAQVTGDAAPEAGDGPRVEFF